METMQNQPGPLQVCVDTHTRNSEWCCFPDCKYNTYSIQTFGKYIKYENGRPTITILMYILSVSVVYVLKCIYVDIYTLTVFHITNITVCIYFLKTIKHNHFPDSLQQSSKTLILVALISTAIVQVFPITFPMINTTTVDIFEPKFVCKSSEFHCVHFQNFPYLRNIQCNSSVNFFPGKKQYFTIDFVYISLIITVRFIFRRVLVTCVYSSMNASFNLCLLTPCQSQDKIEISYPRLSRWIQVLWDLKLVQ